MSAPSAEQKLRDYAAAAEWLAVDVEFVLRLLDEAAAAEREACAAKIYPLSSPPPPPGAGIVTLVGLDAAGKEVARFRVQ